MRQHIDDPIRTSSTFVDVSDFLRLPADKADRSRLRPSYDDSDRLHTGDAGNRAIADAIDLDTIFGDMP